MSPGKLPYPANTCSPQHQPDNTKWPVAWNTAAMLPPDRGKMEPPGNQIPSLSTGLCRHPLTTNVPSECGNVVTLGSDPTSLHTKPVKDMCQGEGGGKAKSADWEPVEKELFHTSHTYPLIHQEINSSLSVREQGSGKLPWSPGFSRTSSGGELP